MIDVFSAASNGEDETLRDKINGTNMLFFGRVYEVIDEKTILVIKMTKFTEQNAILGCRYLGLSTSAIKVNILPKKGDPVIVLSLQHLSDTLFSAEEPEKVSRYNGYGYMSCVAIPFCIGEEEAKVSITVNEEKVSIDAPEVDITINGKSVGVNGTDKHAVYWEDLNAGLADFFSKLKTSMTSTPIAGNGAIVPSWTAFPSKIDIDAAKSSDFTVGK